MPARAASTNRREQELHQPMDGRKVPSIRREDGCIKIDGMYREHIAALAHKTTAYVGQPYATYYRPLAAAGEIYMTTILTTISRSSISTTKLDADSTLI